jgi:pilus assembly protein CpaB
MNRTRLMMIGALALAIAFLVSVIVYKNLQGKMGSSDPGVQVMVAANDLQVGSRVEERDIRVISVPASDLPPGAPRKRSDVIGHGVISPISKGEFILPNRLAAENAGAGLPSLIPPGMRAVSVRVNDVASVSGFVTPGTRVDVLVTASTTGTGEPQTTTVLQNVQVLASGHTLERSSTGEAQNAVVITLLVTPEDAQRLTLATNEGRIQLALRNPVDTRQDEVLAANARALFKGTAAPVAPVTRAPVRHVSAPKIAPPVAPPATGVTVEVYQGDKKLPDVKFPDEGSDTK